MIVVGEWVFLRLRSAGWINANRRRNTHWSTDAELTAAWRMKARAVATPDRDEFLASPVGQHAAGGGKIRIVAYLFFMARRSRSRLDPGNWAPTAKAAVDGLVDAGWLADDDTTRLVGPDMRLWPAQAQKLIDESLILRVTKVDDDEDVSGYPGL